MQFFLALAVLTLGVAAQSTSKAVSTDGCLADYILERCLETEAPKAENCASTDLECLCYAYQAIATCYNNCPDDTRAAPAMNQVTAYCAQVTLTTATPASTVARQTTTEEAIMTQTESRYTNTATFDMDIPGETGNAAADVAIWKAGSVLVALAGAAAVAI
ncbi:uncharacterized protein J7T54_006501 [Emericellopsis cladophorae]|uniref:GPI anchored serine-threonine rich protein n=1 Tax=Emericellopsis cladophorae TaxID=2686198 RepID=A0A9P9Y6S1_9HYPO|nr:uncharacterized protein J7T54_006501 [Emericellopsis cladophorae]KAI6784456.1 hypothetical protein J7T54_006501 [Emericellopsis cladophorae]